MGGSKQLVDAPVESAGSLVSLREAWRKKWPEALAVWSRYVQLSEPRWCLSAEDERREHLAGSFAMIRLVDHAVVIGLTQIQERGLEKFATEILAHEIGHHVYTPADLTDTARVFTRTRAGLPGREAQTALIANLYEDLLINDRLQRSGQLNMAGVYQQIDNRSTDRLWTLYMRIYEILWKLERASLAHGDIDARLDTDAQLGARLIRSYAKQWLDGAGRFAVLCLPYLPVDDIQQTVKVFAPWNDTQSSSAGGLPDGLTNIEEDEILGAIHPAEDPDLSGLDDAAESASSAGSQTKPKDPGGRKSQKLHRGPFEYTNIVKAMGVDLDQQQIIARYYRERAMPYLVRFPTRDTPRSVDPFPEGLDVWEVGEPTEDIDWEGTLRASPVVIPGITTQQRRYGESLGTTPAREAIDLYLGVDCSGSMSNPAINLSYPVLAGSIIALSALRAGAKVMVALSGEPGRTVTTDGFIRDENKILATLTGYLGSGTTFGIHRLHDTFYQWPRPQRAVHILIITDSDIFSMLDRSAGSLVGWDVARDAIVKARGGGTYVLEIDDGLVSHYAGLLTRMQSDGWNTSRVNSMPELIAFARQFSHQKYGT
jgi:hypothetical protein